MHRITDLKWSAIKRVDKKPNERPKNKHPQNGSQRQSGEYCNHRPE